jgi:D-alanine-D-alanine ligase-like ATP-grasp enzyme
MTNKIYVDPSIEMNSEEMVTVIIQFKTKPAQVAVAIAQKAGVPLSLENANWAVKHSHERFQEEVKRYLELKRIPYTINHVYQSALNGVSLSLPAKDIKSLLQFKEIASIHANKQYQIDPPNPNTYYE